MTIDLTNPIYMLFALVVAHNLADYPLQGSFLSEAKNRNTDIGAIFWPWALSAHALIHGGFVFLITGSLVLGLLETAAHAFIDWLKCEGDISLKQDQLAHYGCKLLWVAVACTCF
jgi:hypothetical protein